jgi:hypothetical protein
MLRSASTGKSTMRTLLTLALMGAPALLAAQAAQAATPSCQARSGATAPTVVELYTSEGCSSCPPADQWLSTLKGQPGVLALAFHVNYWDRLGWPDRFATPESTARQWDLARTAGSAQVYTPQVLANGRDWRIWPKLPTAAAASPVSLALTRDGDKITAEISATSGAPNAPTARLAGYWAVLEDQHVSAVRAGENAGATLKHDHVVRLVKPVPAWLAAQGSSSQLNVSKGVPEHPRRVVFVVTDAASQKPVQALALDC